LEGAHHFKEKAVHVHPLEPRMAHLEGACDQINERLGSIDRRIDGIDRRFDSTDHRFDSIDQRFNWLFGLVASTWLTTIAAILPLYFKH
jgi:hypothetical protein